MAIGLLTEIPGMTQEQYDSVLEAGNLRDRLPDGQFVHVAGPVEGGWRVIDVWESREAFDRFASEVLAPLMGGEPPPAPTEFPVHNHLT